MPSPFPGMNPYIEQDDAWHDFHERFLPVAAERIGPQVLPGYIVKIDEHVYIHENPHEPRRLLGRADLAVTPTGHPGPAHAAAGVIAAPAHVQLPAVDVERLAYIEIRDRRSRELVTVIELLEPLQQAPRPRPRPVSGQAGPDPRQPGAPRRDRPAPRRGPDARRRSHRVRLCRPGQPRRGAAPRRLLAHRPARSTPRHPRAPAGGDPDARLDLQEVLDHIYDTGGYAYYIYDGRPEPPLRQDDMAWAQALIPRPA